MLAISLSISVPRLAGRFVIPTQSETTTLLGQMTVQPDANRQALINKLIYDLKNAGLWTTLDFLYVGAAHDAQAARINWINPAGVKQTVNGTPTWTTDRGYNGDGASAYLGCGINWSALTHFVQDNACLGIWCSNESNVGNPVIGTVTTARDNMSPRGGGNFSSRLNCATQSTIAVASSKSHSLATRSAAASYDMYRDGVSLGNQVQTSSAPVAEEIVVLRNQTSYNSAHQVGAAHGGSSLTPTQITAFFNALSSYMSSVGAI